MPAFKILRLMTIAPQTYKKTSDIVFYNLKNLGFSKYFNWIDYRYFKKIAQEEKTKSEDLAQRITDLFLEYNNELSDFADYEF